MRATFTDHSFSKPAIGAALAAFWGIVLWGTTLGEWWVNASYDSLFRFGGPEVTNQVVLILMDNDAYHRYQQDRGEIWDRKLHADLLNRLADDACPLVVLDVFFEKTGIEEADAALAQAMRRLRQVVLMADKMQGPVDANPDLARADSVKPIYPAELFLSASSTNWGIAALDPDRDRDKVVRRHWPFPSPEKHPSLPWRAAQLAGVELNDQPEERWLRYHGMNTAWTSLSYHLALTKPTNYFRNKIVFIGRKPATPAFDGKEDDEFRTPYTRWTGETAGGVEILATSFLNLMNGNWLRRPAWWLEALVLIMMGGLLGSLLPQLRLLAAWGVATAAALALLMGAVVLSYYTNFWFPWLVIAGGQLPVAMAWASIGRKRAAQPATEPIPLYPALEPAKVIEGPTLMIEKLDPLAAPVIPNYKLFDPPLGKGSFGEVWLAKSPIGQWQAIKVVRKSDLEDSHYETEFKGIKRYKPVSEKHLGLLRIELVSEMQKAGYYYYVMELADALDPAWEKAPARPSYVQRDLDKWRLSVEGRRLPVRECVRIGVVLADTLHFLHSNELIHRDIKPSNVIFVNGQPKLADVGTVRDIRPPENVTSVIGTPGYMPPERELLGTKLADTYALGMVLYVISTGRKPASFPDLSTVLMEQTDLHFGLLNPIITKACHSNPAERYASASELHMALLRAQAEIGKT